MLKIPRGKRRSAARDHSLPLDLGSPYEKCFYDEKFYGSAGKLLSGANTIPTNPRPVWAPNTGEMEQSGSH